MVERGFERVGNNGIGSNHLMRVAGGNGYDREAAYAVDSLGGLWGFTSGAWARIAISNDKTLNDVGASVAKNTVWATGRSGRGVYLLNLQNGGVSGSDTPSRSTWEGYPDLQAKSIAVDSNGRPLYVDWNFGLKEATK